MIPSIIEVVSYTSIICMILLYDTIYYDQPKKATSNEYYIIWVDVVGRAVASPGRSWDRFPAS
jgi:hypothetical protein